MSGDERTGAPATMAERMRAGELYIADDPEIIAAAQDAAERAARYNLTSPRDEALRHQLLSDLLGHLGDGSVIRPPLYVDYGQNVYIGARCFVNVGLTALDVARITIGDNVQIGPHVQLLTPTHPLDPRLRREGWEAAEPITIEDNVWLGGGVIICPGVSIGANAVVGAGAVVTRDIPANVLAVGNPARVIRELTDRPGQ